MQIGRPIAYVPPPVFSSSAAGLSAPRTQEAPDGFAVALSSATQPPAAGPVDDAQRYAPQPGNALSYLTPGDRQLIAAATGFDVSSDGVVQNPGKHPVDPMIQIMAIERSTGKLEGDLTASYVTDLFDKYKDAPALGSSFTQARLDLALQFLTARDDRRTDHAPLRSRDSRF